MSTPQLYRVILPVTDIEVAAQFYGRVFEIEGERVSPGRHYFDCGAVTLACYDPVADGDALGAGWTHHENQYLYFSVPDLEAVRSRVAGHRLDLCQVVPSRFRDAATGPRRRTCVRPPLGSRISFVDERTMFTGST